MPRFLEVARQTFLLHLRGRVFLLMCGLFLLFAGVFLLPFIDPKRYDGAELFELVAYMSTFTAVLPFVTMFLAAQAVLGDIEDRTSVYLFTRPISRVSLLAGKWIAVVLLGGGFATLGLTGLFAVIGLTGRSWEAGSNPTGANYLVMVAAGWLAVAGYASVGCLFAAFFRRPLLVAVLYVFLEQFASRLPHSAGIHTATVAFPVRIFMFQTMEPTRELQVTLTAPVRAGSEQGQALLATEPLMVIAKTVVFTMVIAMWIYSRREYDSRPRE